MKYIKKIFESDKKSFSIDEEFQSCSDIIDGNQYISRTSGSDWVQFNFTNFSDRPISIEDFTKEYNERKIINELYDDIIHVCNRLKLDGYELDIISKSNVIRVNIEVDGMKSFITSDYYDCDIQIDRSKLLRFLKKIGIRPRQIQLDEKTINRQTHSTTMFVLAIEITDEPTELQYELFEKEFENISIPNDDDDNNFFAEKVYNNIYFDESEMELSVEFSKDVYVTIT